MASASNARSIPSTPRVISPSPTPEDPRLGGDYFPPVTRSVTKTTTRSGGERARSRRRDSGSIVNRQTATATKQANGRPQLGNKPGDVAANPQFAKMNGSAAQLSPMAAAKSELSRSPSPMGLIPIHQQWRGFVHKHEIPRKALHVSIGFLTLGLYARGYQSYDIPPALMAALIPIAAADVLRHNWPAFNTLYIRIHGAFMRESEAHDKFNGVIWYLLGAWTVLRFSPKDIGVVGVLCLSWCDTAASTIGRRFGRYTPKVRQGKSLAGTLAAMLVGTASSLVFWGWIGPRYEQLGIADNTGENAFAFQGALKSPAIFSQLFGDTGPAATLSGAAALCVLSGVTGIIASASEAIDLFGMDDNLTIPVLCGLGLWSFLRAFGSG